MAGFVKKEQTHSDHALVRELHAIVGEAIRGALSPVVDVALSCKQVKDQLGCGVDFVYDEIQRGHLTAFGTHRCLRVKQSEVDRYILTNTRKIVGGRS